MWLNEYNARVLREIGDEMLLPEGKHAEYEWVKARTQPIDIADSIINSASSLQFNLLIVAAVAVLRFLVSM